MTAPTTAPAFLRSFVDDAALFPPASTALEQALAEHRAHRSGEYADLVGGFVVSDVAVPELGRLVSEPLEINLVITGGAGAIAPGVTWATRSERLRLRAVEIALREEDDLARNAARVTTALEAVWADPTVPVDDQTPVYVEMPRLHGGAPSHGWLAAADELALMEFRLKFRTGGSHPDDFPTAAELAACLEAALDRELPFKCTAGLHHAVRHRDEDTGFEHHGFLNVLVATRASLDGAGPAEVAAVLEDRDGASLAQRLLADPAVAERTRTWFTSFGSCSVLEAHEDLVELGLLGATP